MSQRDVSMKIYLLNGSPRKNWNTAKMCAAFAEGAQSVGAETEIVHLFDLDYKGCYSCFACKLKDGKNYGKCDYPDGIRELLQNVSAGDGVVFASPFYLGDLTASMRGFLERLFFAYHTYDKNQSIVAPKRLATAMIYTMGVPESCFQNSYVGATIQDPYFGEMSAGPIGFVEKWVGIVFTPPERICAFDTYQFDYEKYVYNASDVNAKIESLKTRFPKDLENARQAGIRMVEKIKATKREQ
ncbi:MAG: flavodoxin family protein [Thermoguttaceae bacterium]